MRKKWLTYLVISSLVLFLTFACAPKVVKKEEGVAKKPEGPTAEELAVLKKEAAEREAALKKELAEKEKALKEAALREEALKKEAAEREAALKKEAAAAIKPEEKFKLTDIHFAFDDFSLTQESMQILGKTAAWLLANKEVKIQIEGHADERGTNEYNLALGERRANSAKNYLVTLGVDAKRLSTISYGEEKPLDPGHNEEAWSKNRRDHFVAKEK